MGVASEAKLIFGKVKTTASNTGGGVADVTAWANGIDWAVNWSDANGNKTNIVVMNIGYSQSYAPVEAAIERAEAAGIYVIAVQQATDNYPAKNETVIAANGVYGTGFAPNKYDAPLSDVKRTDYNSINISVSATVTPIPTYTGTYPNIDMIAASETALYPQIAGVTAEALAVYLSYKGHVLKDLTPVQVREKFYAEMTRASEAFANFGAHDSKLFYGAGILTFNKVAPIPPSGTVIEVPVEIIKEVIVEVPVAGGDELEHYFENGIQKVSTVRSSRRKDIANKFK